MGLSCREMAKKKVGFLFFQFEEKKFELPDCPLPGPTCLGRSHRVGKVIYPKYNI